MTAQISPDGLDAEVVRARKDSLRVSARRRRDALAADIRVSAARTIEARLVALPSLEAAQVVHCYVGIGSEVATETLIERLLMRGQRVVCPRVSGPGQLEHLEVTALDSLVDGPMGLREPSARGAQSTDLAEVDVMLVPALAFDHAGYRLGYGGGYYDRAIEELMSHHRATTIGLALEMQLLDEVPREAHDRAVDLIVTDTQTIVTGAP